jgi:hypothetical protein
MTLINDICVPEAATPYISPPPVHIEPDNSQRRAARWNVRCAQHTLLATVPCADQCDTSSCSCRCWARPIDIQAPSQIYVMTTCNAPYVTCSARSTPDVRVYNVTARWFVGARLACGPVTRLQRGTLHRDNPAVKKCLDPHVHWVC